jgi:hypothetical protein
MELYIPASAKTQAEIFSGFGKNELLKSIVGAAAGFAVAALAYLISKEITLAVMTAIASIFASVVLCAKIENVGQSAVDIVADQIRFSRSQKIYPYRYLNEWEGGK